MSSVKQKLDRMKLSILLGCIQNNKDTQEAVNKDVFQGLAIHQLFVVERGLEGEFEEYLNELQIDLEQERKHGKR